MRLNPDPPEENIEKELPPIPPGQVRPLTDPESVLRWFAAHEPVEPEWEYNPFSRYHMNR
jgi:hypothetical protein